MLQRQVQRTGPGVASSLLAIALQPAPQQGLAGLSPVASASSSCSLSCSHPARLQTFPAVLFLLS